MSIAETVNAELISLCPGFAKVWDSERGIWSADDGTFTVHGVFAAFSNYIRDRLVSRSSARMRRVFAYVESKLTGEDSEVDNAVCTCFLENLMNCVPQLIAPQKLVPLLGPKSREFCRAWDRWCGMETEGLS